jgi:quercetin dioxygenase-like cupin family protein
VGKIEVVRRDDLGRGAATGGIARSQAFETPTLLQTESKIEGGAISAWHHHGKRDLYGFLVSGRLRLEDADGDAVELSPGDFFHIPVGLVHRDVNLDGHEEAWVVGMLLGGGPSVVNVDLPKKGAHKTPKVKARR